MPDSGPVLVLAGYCPINALAFVSVTGWNSCKLQSPDSLMLKES